MAAPQTHLDRLLADGQIQFDDMGIAYDHTTADFTLYRKGEDSYVWQVYFDDALFDGEGNGALLKNDEEIVMDVLGGEGFPSDVTSVLEEIAKRF